jgi:hypothetical protein
MTDLFDRHVLPVTCVKCGAKIQKEVAWLKAHDELACPCGTRMHLETGELTAALKALAAALHRLPRPAPAKANTHG